MRIKNDYWILEVNPSKGCQIEMGMVHLENGWADLLPPQKHNARSFLMLPYSNRIKDGLFHWNGNQYQLSYPQKHALHGPVRRMQWKCIYETSDELHFSLKVNAHDNPLKWPFAFSALYKVSVEEKELKQKLIIKNEEDFSVPFGGGFHPYFLRSILGSQDVVKTNLCVEAVYPTSEPNFPNENPVVNDLVSGLNENRQLTATDFIDDVFIWSDRSASLSWPRAGVQLKITASQNLKYLVFYNPEEDFFAIEPVANINDSLNNRLTEIIKVDPGQESEMEMVWKLTFS